MKIQFKKRVLYFVPIPLLIGISFYYESERLPILEPGQVVSCFTPEKKCLPLLVNAIDRAKDEIIVHSFAFTSFPLKASLERATHRGVTVRLYIDEGQLKSVGTEKLNLKMTKIKIIPMKMKSLFHNKSIIIDGTLVITGSYNWTNGAEYRNSENLLFLNSPDLAKSYKERTFRHGQ